MIPDHLLESVATAALSGGSAAVSAIVAFFHGVKKKVEELEKKVGSVDSRTGLMFSVHTIETTIGQMRQEISGWATHPPEWLVAALARRGRAPSFHGMDDYPHGGADDNRLRVVENKLKDFEETLERIERKMKGFVTEEDFENADRQRADDIATVRTTIAEVNGLLKGLQTALGMVKDPGYRR